MKRDDILADAPRLGRLYAFTAIVLLAGAEVVDAQYGRAKTTPDASQRASVTQVIGVDTEVTIVYHRPGVRGRNVWDDDSLFRQIGKLVPYDGDPRPWRAGANETTTFEVEDDVTVEGRPLAAGKYGLFMIPRSTEWIIVFSREWKTWGSFDYDESADVLRVEVIPEAVEFSEWLEYGFDELSAFSARAYLRWEKKKVPFRIELLKE